MILNISSSCAYCLGVLTFVGCLFKSFTIFKLDCFSPCYGVVSILYIFHTQVLYQICFLNIFCCVTVSHMCAFTAVSVEGMNKLRDIHQFRFEQNKINISTETNCEVDMWMTDPRGRTLAADEGTSGGDRSGRQSANGMTRHLLLCFCGEHSK